jgi:hypothetical protein
MVPEQQFLADFPEEAAVLIADVGALSPNVISSYWQCPISFAPQNFGA